MDLYLLHTYITVGDLRALHEVAGRMLLAPEAHRLGHSAVAAPRSDRGTLSVRDGWSSISRPGVFLPGGEFLLTGTLSSHGRVLAKPRVNLSRVEGRLPVVM